MILVFKDLEGTEFKGLNLDDNQISPNAERFKWNFRSLPSCPCPISSLLNCYPNEVQAFGLICTIQSNNNFRSMSRNSAFANHLANRKRQIMVGFRVFLNHFERIANLKGELTSELCFTVLDTLNPKKKN